MKRVLLACAFVVPLAATVQPQASNPHKHTPPGAPADASTAALASHHSCLEQERAALERGEGFGMALAADRNGYPGPRHVLELQNELKLTPQQEAAMEKLLAQMHSQAVKHGKEVLTAEERLEAMFAQNRPEAELREQSYRVATSVRNCAGLTSARTWPRASCSPPSNSPPTGSFAAAPVPPNRHSGPAPALSCGPQTACTRRSSLGTGSRSSRFGGRAGLA